MAATYDLISSQEFTGNSNTCVFNSFSGYTDLVIQGNFTVSGGSYDIYVRFNNDNSNSYEGLVGTNTQSSTFDNNAWGPHTGISLIGAYNSPINNTILPVHFELNIPEYSNVYRKNGTATFSYIANLSDNRSNTGWMAWHWRNASAITNISILSTSGGNFTGTINLYGILAGNA